MRVVTWNVNCWNPGWRERKRRLLELEPWDVALLQEVGPETFETFVEMDDVTGVSAIDLVGGPWRNRSHGTAVLVRGSFRITDHGLMPLLEADPASDPWRCARAMWATVETPSGPVLAASIHTLNAAGRGEDRERKVAEKMAHYRSIAAWVGSDRHRLVVGLDANEWRDWSEPVVVEADDPFADQASFLAIGADHGLRDVLVDHLVRNQPELLARRQALGAEGGDGALAVTYQRSKGYPPRVNRMDRILVSPDLVPDDVRTLYEDALTVGSDHAMVIADLRFTSEPALAVASDRSHR